MVQWLRLCDSTAGHMGSIPEHEFEQTLGESEGQGTLGAAVHAVAESVTT